MKQRLRHIADMEHCTVSDGQLDTILTVAEGDMRRAVTTLQSVHALRGVGTGEDGIIIDDDAIAEIAGIPPPRVIHELYQAIQSDLFDTMKTAVEEVCLSGYSAQAVLGCHLDGDLGRGGGERERELRQIHFVSLLIDVIVL